MTREEYKENVIRMWDSIRSDYKGIKTCDGVSCSNCPFNGKVCNLGELVFNSYEAIEVVENWAKEHPVKTNADKFKEVFGMERLPFYSCIDTNAKCEDCEYYNGSECDADNMFWNAEYKPKKRGKNNGKI